MNHEFGGRELGAVVLDCPTDAAPEGPYWVEIDLVDEYDQPVPWEEFLLLLPGGRKVSGYLNGEGRVRVAGLEEPGPYRVTFPALDAREWDAA